MLKKYYKYYKWHLIIISALAYSLAFIWPEYLWVLAFLFLVPIFYMVIKQNLVNKLSFKEGLVWGLIVYSTHEFGVYYSLIQMAESYKLLILILVFFITIYQAIYSALWFYISSKIIKLLNINNIFFILFVWILTTWCYFYFVENYVLWIFDAIEGNFLAYPLLPLATIPDLLYLLNIIGKSALLLILIITSALLSLFLVSKNIYLRFCLILILISPWLFSFLLSKDKQEQKTPEWLKKIAYVSEAFYNSGDNKKTVKEIADKLKLIVKKYPNVKIVLFPESAFFLCSLIDQQELLKFLDQTNILKPLHILIGAIRQKENKCYNSVYWIYNGKIIDWFDKRHAMVLTERLPSWIDFDIFRKSYFDSRPIIKPCTKARKLFKISNKLALVPYICSEIFFNDKPDDNFNSENLIIASLCNDSWIYSMPYLENLMALANRFRAVQWQRPIIYVAYNFAYLFDKTGNKFNLNGL